MRISAKADYAIRATAELAAADEQLLTAERIARAQGIPLKFLLGILGELKVAGIVESQRGSEGGYRLAREPHEIRLADVIRAVEGPLATIQERRPEELRYPGPARALRDVWVAVRANLRAVLEGVTVADLVAGSLPEHVSALLGDPEAWASDRTRKQAGKEQ